MDNTHRVIAFVTIFIPGDGPLENVTYNVNIYIFSCTNEMCHLRNRTIIVWSVFRIYFLYISVYYLMLLSFGAILLDEIPNVISRRSEFCNFYRPSSGRDCI